MRLEKKAVKDARAWLGLSQSELAREANVSTLTIKRAEKSGCGGALARLITLLCERPEPAVTRPSRSTAKCDASNSRPAYKTLKAGDWEATKKYSTVSLKLDGWYGEFTGGPDGWILRDRSGRPVTSGDTPVPRCHLLCENLSPSTTQWARYHAPRELGRIVAWGGLDASGNDISRAALEALVDRLQAAGVSITASLEFPVSEAPAVWDDYVLGANWEGLVFKSADGVLAKMKPRYTWDYVCVCVDGCSVAGGVYTQHGALVKDAVHCRLPDDVDIDIGEVFEVSGLGVSDRGVMRSPKFERLRPDKPARECLTPLAVASDA